MGDFTYLAPRTLQEALAALHEAGESARVIAGCTNVAPDIRAKKIRSGVLVDIKNVGDLQFITEEGATVRIGAATTIARLLESQLIREKAGILWEACKRFADPLVRNLATIGGNLANASPAADTAVPLLALGASVQVESVAYGLRKLPLESFFLGPNKTALRPGELLTAVEFTVPGATARGAFFKFGLRRSMAISLVSLAVLLRVDGGTIGEARVALGAVAPTPVRARETEEFLRGKAVTHEVVEEAARRVGSEIWPISDVRASREYRRYLAGILLKRALERTCGNKA